MTPDKANYLTNPRRLAALILPKIGGGGDAGAGRPAAPAQRYDLYQRNYSRTMAGHDNSAGGVHNSRRDYARLIYGRLPDIVVWIQQKVIANVTQIIFHPKHSRPSMGPRARPLKDCKKERACGRQTPYAGRISNLVFQQKPPSFKACYRTKSVPNSVLRRQRVPNLVRNYNRPNITAPSETARNK
ncbi:hypothetical protein EVAR_14696_1 [Eumeta japonica]|uniref:Uncharacterized protein n=1 Tax=Eumeta variegata TaxID=151549 RepID=A0A4C1U2S4_EUMVA|nr:hypothetical protein EVAR_14696_1 [Eumeta japonica]